MVKLFSSEHTYKHPWSRVSQAWFLKYPNPMASHVRNVDTFNRHLDPQTGALHLHRIVSAKTNLPKFATAIGAPAFAHGLEQSVLDPRTQKLTLRSRNLTGSNLMTVEETCTYEPHPDNPSWTLYRQEAKITSFTPMLRGPMEQTSVSNLAQQAKKGLECMELLCSGLASETMDHLSNFFPLSAVCDVRRFPANECQAIHKRARHCFDLHRFRMPSTPNAFSTDSSDIAFSQ